VNMTTSDDGSSPPAHVRDCLARRIANTNATTRRRRMKESDAKMTMRLFGLSTVGVSPPRTGSVVGAIVVDPVSSCTVEGAAVGDSGSTTDEKTLDGDAVGTALGMPVSVNAVVMVTGVVVGSDDGSYVGVSVGVNVGVNAGVSVGVAVGAAVVGCKEGANVGVSVGVVVGGAVVGSTVVG
jgi:hypothetical protein